MASTPKLAQMGANMDAAPWRGILEQQGTRAWLLADTDKRFGPDTPDEIVQWYADEGSKTAAAEVIALQGCLLAADLTPLLPDITVPTLILGASHDDITPVEIQHLMAKQMPEARLELIDGVGHNMKVEIPDALADRTLQIVNDVDARL